MRVSAFDDGGGGGPADVESVPSGVRQMAISMDGSFANVAWRPFESTVDLWLPDASQVDILVKVRDGANLESTPVRVHVARGAPRHGADRAVALEERALDALRANQWAEARRLVAQSLVPLRDTVERLLPRCGPGGSPVDRDLRARFVAVLARKVAVDLLLIARKRPPAERLLLDALEAEREAVRIATQAGRPL